MSVDVVSRKMFAGTWQALIANFPLRIMNQLKASETDPTFPFLLLYREHDG
jgi:hypothetical protein